MDKQNLRMFFLVGILSVGLFLYNLWTHEHQAQVKKEVQSEAEKTQEIDLPKVADTEIKTITHKDEEPALPDSKKIIKISTGVMNLKINLEGGDIVYLDLPHYPKTLKDKDQGFVLLNTAPDRYYVVQSGLLSTDGPDSSTLGRAVYSADKAEYTLTNGKLSVDLKYKTPKGVGITKRFIFTENSYEVAVKFIVNNKSEQKFLGNFYGRIRRTVPVDGNSKGFGAMRTYTGAAVNTPEKKYYKISFSDMSKNQFKQTITSGWAAMIEHYFTTAWVPPTGTKNYYQSEVFADHSYGIGFVGQQLVVPAGEAAVAEASIYMGPGITDVLKALALGLDLTVDYGIFWWICQPLFILLKWLHSLIGNWGASIILITLIIKAAFYKLSASSYRSMGNMKKLQPRIEALKKSYSDDKQKFGQAVMELYRKEKVNPLGGCLPILIQIPVFISLYYVLLESVELRQAPFALWIQDLSAKDPFYVLPLIMGASMFLQQKMNPAPPDPIQAKVMMAMPFVFTVLFLQFPSGLMLYWVVNNLLSILQQWMITRKMNAPSPSHSKKAAKKAQRGRASWIQ